MKVDVITVEQATFKKWQWWSNWIDVAVYQYAGEGILIQMRVSRTNAKHFKSRPFTKWCFQKCELQNISDLTQMKKEGIK